MSITITLDQATIDQLDLQPAHAAIPPLQDSQTILDYEQQVQFEIAYPRVPEDPREWSEIPEIRLWFVRLDACYPWFPLLLDWQAGELARYAAMLIPHQFHPTEGIQFNPEALEIFVMHKTFVLLNWLTSQGLDGVSRLKSMTQILGYELSDDFFALVKRTL
jgi:hypothetical protein